MPEQYRLKDGKGEDDGCFLICYNDFRKIFSNLFIGYNLSLKEWSGW
jgi:hypothetical protein